MTSATIPVVPLSAVSDPAALQASGAAFDQIAREARSRAADSASPSQFGSMVLENLGGYFERASRFSGQAASHPPSEVRTLFGQATAAPNPVPSSQIDRVIASLGTVFNYSIETQLVVRGGTQISGAANTLLRGQ